MTRFTTRPQRFGLKPMSTRTYAGIFRDFQAAPPHQIGGCQVRNGNVFVGVGDGGNPAAASDQDQLLGKLLCITVGGGPCGENRFAGKAGPRRFVWAYGFRNPFGIALVGERVFVSENGISIDRFLQARHGQGHHWNGSDTSIGTDADFVFFPAVSPVHIVYHDRGTFPREWNNTFFVGTVGGLGLPEQLRRGRFVGILALPYTSDADKPEGPPRPVLEYRGDSQQAIAGVAMGDDGLYAAELLPVRGRSSSVLRLHHDPANAHEVVIGAARDRPEGRALMDEYGCTSCHALDEGGGGTAPTLDPFGLSWRLRPRLQSEDYERQVAKVDRLRTAPYDAYRDERRRVLSKAGNERLVEWIKYKILEPKFDDPSAQMPDVGASEKDAEVIADYLGEDLHPSPEDALAPDSLVERVRRRKKAVAAGFAAGVVTCVGLAAVAAGAFYIRRRRWRPA